MTTKKEIHIVELTKAQSARYVAIRSRSLALAEPLSAEDCCVQSMPDASPIKWHLGHTTWFFETFILERIESDFKPHHPAFRVLFNSYYNGVGEKHPRAQRGLLTRPSLREVLAYRQGVDARIARCIERGLPSDIAALFEVGLQHEQQHQELMLTDIKHLLSMNPLTSASDAAPLIASVSAAPIATWQKFDGGLIEIGYAGSGFCFDNETPRHRQFVEGFSLSSRLVTNGEFLDFIEAGGYENSALWLSEGWDWIRQQAPEKLRHPLYWHRLSDSSEWQEFTLHGWRRLDREQPATHLSYFEADAYAHWAGARLPTEAEWECAAGSAEKFCQYQAMQGNADEGLEQLFGVCWQWTSSSYAPYPGYAIADGAIGEYNGKFMVNQYVLRGSSGATPERHSRISYRNFFPATARWQFTGVRLAKSR